MSFDLDDTIAAVASPPGGARRGIIRVSGPKGVEVLAKVFHRSDGKPLPITRPAVIFDGNLRVVLGGVTLTRSVSEGAPNPLASFGLV
jgi:tRNA U34 5-carboxymethylaminomethyl modifying GTPase MnmE/TrmE